MFRTKEDWDVAVNLKISQVLADSSPLNVTSSITKPDEELALNIDHTLLKSDATPTQIDNLCDQAIRYKFKSCCVNGTHIKRVAERLQGSQSVPCAVIGFPLGAGKSSVKAFEAKEAVIDGAKEIDMVINIGALKEGDYKLVYDDIRAVIEASAGNVVKVILETIFLSEGEKIAASYIAAEAGANFVKTCTGFCGGGASTSDVILMRKTVTYKTGVKVKASAGIRSFEKCLEMLQAGAERLGTSSGAAIMEDANIEQ